MAHLYAAGAPAEQAGGLPIGPLLLLAALAAAGLAAAVVWHRLNDPYTAMWMRLRLHMRPGPGFASRWELWRRYGLPRARKVARHARPSLRGRDMYGPGAWREVATFLGWGQGWLHRWRVYASLSDIVLTIAAPQKGKSAAAAGRIIDAPGPVVVTSIRGDLIAQTAGLRQEIGRLHVFNPEGVGEYGSTFRWNPVAGCHDMQTAIRRAGHMVEAVEGRGLSDSNFWSDKAVQVLASYMHAAGLVRGGTMTVVHRWVVGGSRVPLDILDQAGQLASEAALAAIAEYQGLNDRTRQSIETTVRNVLRFMLNPEAEQALTPDEHVPEFVVGDFLTSRDTLYLVASAESDSTVAPVLCALLAELKHVAVLIGSRLPSGRLDPPLSMELDEVANITPIPLPVWASYAAGSGIRLSVYSQSWGQIVDRWGANGADTLWQTATCKVVMSGTSEESLLRRLSALCGKIQIPTRTQVDAKGRKHKVKEWVEVLPVDGVRRLPPGRAVVLVDAGQPTIVRCEQVWKRADVKRWKRSSGIIGLPPRGVPARRRAPLEAEAPAEITAPLAGDIAEYETPASTTTAAPASDPAGAVDQLAARRQRRRRPYEETAPATPGPAAAETPGPGQQAGETVNGWNLNDL